MNKFTFALASIVLLFAFGSVSHAEVVKQDIPTGSAPTVDVTVVADINLGDVKVTEVAGTYSGSFTLLGKMGLQNDIVYGVVVYDSTRHVVDLKKLGELNSLRQGELKRIDFTYTVPKVLTGTVTVSLEAYTKGGLLIGAQTLGTKKYPASTAPLTCSGYGDTAKCVAKNAGTYSVSRYAGSFFSTAAETKSWVAKVGESEVLASLFSGTVPGSYVVTLAGAPDGGVVAYPMRIPGSYVTVQNLVISREADGIHVVGVLTGSAKELSARLAFTPASGSTCEAMTVPVVAYAFDAKLSASCTEGTVALAVVGPDGATLGQATAPFSVLTSAEKQTPSTAPSSSTGMSLGSYALPIAGVLVVLVIIGLIAFFWRRRSEPVVLGRGDDAPPTNLPGAGAMMLLLAMSFMLLGAPKAEALTLRAHVTGDNFEIGHWCFITISGNSSYTAGDTMTLNADVNITSDVPSGYNHWACTVAWRDISGEDVIDPLNIPKYGPVYDAGSTIVGGAPAWGHLWADIGTPTWLAASRSEDRAFPVYSNMTVGQHSLTLRLLLDTDNNNIQKTANANWVFDVVAPASVEVHFTP